MKKSCFFKNVTLNLIQGLTVVISLLFLITNASAFDSGSTGADGAFEPTADTELQLPDDGIFNFTTVNIPSGVTVTFKKNAANTPVYILTQEDVVIAGTINVNGGSVTSSTSSVPGIGGPGGYDGGYGGATGSLGGRGLGPGGGEGGPFHSSTASAAGGGGGFGTEGGRRNSSTGSGGPTYGNARLVPLIGGSGGGGRGGDTDTPGSAGGGGGGAILIASSITITVTGLITAKGGDGYKYSGSGSGGAIKLMANTISGNGNISAKGGGSYVPGGAGRIRLEAYTVNITAGTDPLFSYGEPGSVFTADTPTLTIISIAGVNVPANPTGSYAQPDIMLPSDTINPVTVNLSASNIPVGTTVTVSVKPQNGAATDVQTILSGTASSSTASADVNLSTGYTDVVMAQATFTLQTAMYYDGEKIEKVRVAATMGRESEAFYITESGKEIPAKELMAKVIK